MKSKKAGSRGAEALKGKKFAPDRNTLEFAGILVIALVSLLILVYFVFPNLFEVGEQVKSLNATSIDVTVTGGQQPSADREACLKLFGIESETVIYIYSDTCAFSAQMTPWVQELQNKGYKFFLANTKNIAAIDAVATCLSDVASMESTPEFVCPANGKSAVGTFSSAEDLKRFADACK
jgi:hypothetical protein